MIYTRRTSTIVLALTAVIALVAVVTLSNRSASADIGTTQGRAANIEGSLLGVGIATSAVTLPADGGPVTSGEAIDADVELDILLQEVSIGATSGNVVSHCEGTPDGPTVSAHCYTTIEDLSIGLTATPLIGNPTSAPIITASSLQAHSTCTYENGSVSCTPQGTTAVGLQVAGAAVSFTPNLNIPVSVLGLVTGTVSLNQQSDSSFGGGSNGLEVTLLEVELDAVGGLVNILDLRIGVADTYLSGLIDSPSITSINPTQGPASGGTSVTITGDDFTGATQVRFGTTPATSFTVNNDGQITAVSPPHAPGTVDVTVTTPAGTSETTTAGRFTFIDDSPPSVTGVSPNQGPASGGTTVTITGDNFTGATQVRFGTTPATSFTVNNDGQITATSPAHSPGTVNVTVTTPNGTSPTTTAGQFTFIDDRPSISGLNPDEGPASGGTSVTITGDNFTGATQVRFGEIPATSFTVNNDGQITAISPPHAPGIVNVTVTSPAGTSPTTSAGDFTYFDDRPSVTGVNPDRGPASGGTTVTISGDNFTGATQVRFGTTPAASFTVNNDGQITAISPAHAPATVFVTVVGPGGTSSETVAGEFTFFDDSDDGIPSVFGVSPNFGPASGGTDVTITGADFTGATSVKFGDTEASGFIVNNDGQITATSPAHAPGTVVVSVTTPNGTSPATPAAHFTFVDDSGGDVPVIASLSPRQGPTSGGTVVTISGANFTGATGVAFGSVAAANFTVVNDSQIIATSPAHSAGTVNVSVTNPDGTSANTVAGQFTFVEEGDDDDLPVVTGVNPDEGPTEGGTTVIITGENFEDVVNVKFGDEDALDWEVDNDGQITAVSPPQEARTVTIFVITEAGTSASHPDARFTYVDDDGDGDGDNGGVGPYGFWVPALAKMVDNP